MFNYRGRMRRKYYWLCGLYNFLLSLCLDCLILFILVSLGYDPEEWPQRELLLYLPFWLMGLAAAIRRLHDSGRSGYWVLVPVVSLVFLVWPGQQGANRFGNATKATECR